MHFWKTWPTRVPVRPQVRFRWKNLARSINVLKTALFAKIKPCIAKQNLKIFFDLPFAHKYLSIEDFMEKTGPVILKKVEKEY